jgi:hypothetical protein
MIPMYEVSVSVIAYLFQVELAIDGTHHIYNIR